MVSAFFASLLQNCALPQAGPVTPWHSSKHYLSPTSSPAGPPDSSSPLPHQEDELHLCLEAFGHAKSIATEAIEVAVEGLAEKHYTADALSFVGVQQVAEITQLAEGEAASLLKFSKQWSGRVDQKRAHLTAPGPSYHHGI